ncbi:MAG: Crp/Fnr family transcriptional regulator [Salinarimonadaceae bacterium]|nr:MAG: Crp/Fnr family transcriptional regulator [Salinarimonadaceae bacterium]
MSLEDDIAMLAQAPLFGLLDRDALRLLAFAADKRRLRQGDVLFRKGDRADAGFVVAEGEIGFDTEGGKPVVIARAGDLVGRTALFVSGERPATATAREPTTVLRVSIDLMKRVLEEYPDAAAAMHDEIARDLQALTGELAHIGERLA